ncbi:MAG: leucine-rich repeat domain-containing protein [Ruminococcus sp.]|nr:leucine-rich repeat domain-containing protein [Ruminococcus sp.]
MKKSFIRLLSTALSALMLISLFTVSAFAADANFAQTGGEGGSEGDITWGWTSATNTLTIGGTGDMNSYDEENLPPWYDYRNDIDRIEVDEGVESIGWFAFYGLYNAKEIVLPESLTFIGGWAFSGCDSLKTISIPKNVSNIHRDAWDDTYISEFIVDPLNQNYLAIDGSLYAYNSDNDLVLLKYANGIADKNFIVPDTVVKISEEAFDDCTILTKITITKNVKEISSYAIKNCPALTSIEVVENSKYFYSQSGVLFKKNAGNTASLLRYPQAKSSAKYTVPDATSEILTNAFSDAVKLKSVIIPDSVNKIGMYAFWNCARLSSVDLGCGVKNIGYFAFDCPSLKAVYIPKSVTSISTEAFGFMSLIGGEAKVSGFKLYYVKGASNADMICDYCANYGIAKDYLTLSSPSLKAGAAKSIVPAVGVVKSWVSNKKSVAAVKNGKIYALKKGKATITAKLSDGMKLTGKVTVKTNPKLSKSSVTVKKGKTVSVKITGKVKEIKNVYTNTKTAKITSSKSATTLKVKGLKKGTTTLKVKVNGYSLSLKVKVN